MRLPFFTSYTDKIEGGDAFMCRVRINPKHKENLGLHLHEYQHVKQWYKGLAIGLATSSLIYILGFPLIALLGATVSLQLKGLAYTFIPYARKIMEAEAHRVQIDNTEGDHKEFFIGSLMNNYNLKITKREARKLLYGVK